MRGEPLAASHGWCPHSLFTGNTMDIDDQRYMAIFFDVYSGLPRAGPGDDASTARALAMVELPPGARILDLACGPGMQTLVLAERVPDARITALDIHQPFLDVLAAGLVARGFDRRVSTVCGDMGELEFPPESLDLIWCEGGAYILGFERALGAWRPLLRPDGLMAVTDLVWLDADPPQTVRRFFAEEYPDMADVAARTAAIRRTGYRPVGHFTLPDAAWWEHYYRPLQERLPMLKQKYTGDPTAQGIIASAEKEMEIHRDFSACYGYEFFVMRR